MSHREGLHGRVGLQDYGASKFGVTGQTINVGGGARLD